MASLPNLTWASFTIMLVAINVILLQAFLEAAMYLLKMFAMRFANTSEKQSIVAGLKAEA